MISDQLVVNRVGSFWVLSFGIYLPERDGVWLLNQPRSGDIIRVVLSQKDLNVNSRRWKRW